MGAGPASTGWASTLPHPLGTGLTFGEEEVGTITSLTKMRVTKSLRSWQGVPGLLIPFFPRCHANMALLKVKSLFKLR